MVNTVVIVGTVYIGTVEMVLTLGTVVTVGMAGTVYSDILNTDIVQNDTRVCSYIYE